MSVFEELSKTVPTPIEHEKLVGTRWNNWCDLYQSQVSVEFVDNTNCVYSLTPRKFSETYTVSEGKVYISNIEGAFELRGNVLFNNDIPVFAKAA